MFILARDTGDGQHSVVTFSRKDSWFAGMPDIMITGVILGWLLPLLVWVIDTSELLAY